MCSRKTDNDQVIDLTLDDSDFEDDSDLDYEEAMIVPDVESDNDALGGRDSELSSDCDDVNVGDENIESNKVVKYYDGNTHLPIYRSSSIKEYFSIVDLAEILLVKPIPSNKLCSRQPLRVQHNIVASL
jgi:hypothetical protein